jgi:hypothetical protein
MEIRMIGANYFHDGYSQKGYVAAAPLLHGSLCFTYRPALVEERSQMSDAAASLKGHLYDRQAAALMAEKIVLWDLADANGRAVAVTAESLLRLQPTLFVKLHRIVMGWTATDIDPTWPEEVVGRAMDDERVAILSGRCVGELREERDEKN